MFIKYFVGSTFNIDKFVELCRICGIAAVNAGDGIILNKDHFNEIPSYELPHWLWLNKADINSQFHTRTSSSGEYMQYT